MLVAEGQDHLGHDGRIMVQQSMQLAQGRQHCKKTGGHVHLVIDVSFVAGRCSGE